MYKKMTWVLFYWRERDGYMRNLRDGGATPFTFCTPTYCLLPVVVMRSNGYECRCTMCDSQPSLVASGNVVSSVVGSVSRARHEDSTKVERCRRDVWPAVGREVGVDADRAVSDSVTPTTANQASLPSGDCISSMCCACG
jgi:hypothetical protein